VEVFKHAGRCLVDLYKNLHQLELMKKLVIYDEFLEQLIKYSRDPDFGAFLVAPHLSNFDLCLLAMAYHGLKAKVLTYGQPRGGYQIQNELREKTGLEITPVSEDTHRQAVEHLSKGGMVITAVDRPIRKKVQRLSFFNQPSPLPVGHIRMSIEAGVPVIVASASMDIHGRYSIEISEPIHMVTDVDPKIEIRVNAEEVLSEIEKRIKKHPGQWLMFYPVWPEVEIKR
jgi:lauroyl/myristoyl acyltransferase